jgi:hypothetical protein
MKLTKKLELRTTKIASMTPESSAQIDYDYTSGGGCGNTGLCFTWLCTAACGSGICCPCE